MVEDRLSVAMMVMATKERERPEIEDGLNGLQVLATEGKCRNRWARGTTRSEIAMGEQRCTRERAGRHPILESNQRDNKNSAKASKTTTDQARLARYGATRYESMGPKSRLQSHPVLRGGQNGGRMAGYWAMNTLRATKQDDAGMRRARLCGHGDVIDKDAEQHDDGKTAT